MFRAGFSSIAFTDLTVNSACDDLFPGVEDVDAQATLQLRAALDAFDEGVYEYHSRAALGADGRSGADAGGVKGRAPRRTRREQAYASRIPEDRQCFRPVEQQSAEWAAFKPHLWLRGRQVLPSEPAALPHPHGHPGQAQAHHMSPGAATAAAAAAGAAAHRVVAAAKAATATTQAAGAGHGASPPAVPAAPAVTVPGAEDAELSLHGSRMKLEKPPPSLEGQEELLAAHGDYEETFMVQSDEWEAHVPPNMRRRRGRPRDEKAVAIGLPPVEPRRAVLYDVAETLLPELWSQLAPLLAPLLGRLAEERQQRPASRTTSAFRTAGGGRGGGDFEILTFSSGDEDDGGGFGAGGAGVGPDLVWPDAGGGDGGGEYSSGEGDIGGGGRGAASFFSSGVGVGGASFGSRRGDSYATDGGESLYDTGSGALGAHGGQALRPLSPDAPSAFAIRAGAGSDRFRTLPPPVLPRDHWPPDPAAPAPFTSPPPLNPPGPLGNALSLVPLSRAGGPPGGAAVGAGAAVSQPVTGNTPGLSPLTSPSQSRTHQFTNLRPSLGSCCGGVSEGTGAPPLAPLAVSPLAPLLQLPTGGPTHGSPSPTGHSGPHHPHIMQHSLGQQHSQSRLHPHQPPLPSDSPQHQSSPQPPERLPPAIAVPSAPQQQQPPHLQPQQAAAEALALLALGPLRGTAAGASSHAPQQQQPGPARRMPSLDARPSGHASPVPSAAVVIAQSQGGPGLLEVSGIVPAGAAAAASGSAFTRMSAPGGVVSSLAGSRAPPPNAGGKATWAGGGGGGGGGGIGIAGGPQTSNPVTSVAAAAFALHARFLGPAAAGSSAAITGGGGGGAGGVGAPAGPGAAGSLHAGASAVVGGGPAAAGGHSPAAPPARRLAATSSHHLHAVHLAPLAGATATAASGAAAAANPTPAAVAAASAAATAAAAAAAAQRRQQQQPGGVAALQGMARKPSSELLAPPLGRPSLSGAQEPLQVQRRANSTTAAAASPHKGAQADMPLGSKGSAPPLQPPPALPLQSQPPQSQSPSGGATRLPALSLSRSTTGV